MTYFAFFALCCLTAVSPMSAAEKETAPETADIKAEEVLTEHKVVIMGKEIAYKAVAGTLPLKDDKGHTKASLFYIAYTRSDVDEVSKRPIAFCFNGGPGSSSVWLHMGILGPKRVKLLDEKFNAPPFSYTDNEYSLLDVADLVFIDPISTGYSRPAPNEDSKQFHGVDEDVKWVAEFVRLYTTRNGRWDAPKYLIGESYGTTRAAAMAEYLHDTFKMYLNGVILVSSILDFQTLDKFEQERDLPSMLYLPTYTAAAWYHKKLASDLQARDLTDVINEAKDFALKDYALALLQGDRLNPQERTAIAARLSRLTGLSTDYIEQSNLRINMYRYVKELMRAQNRTLGRFDARYLGVDSDRTGLHFEYDPSADAIFGAFTGTFNQYVRTDLKWVKDENYEILADVQPWNYTKATNCFLNVAPNLRSAMLRNPDLRVLVCNGYYDLATPFTASDYTFTHLNLDPLIAKNITLTYYPAGHMMYVNLPSLTAMSKDLRDFIIKETPR